MLPGIIVGAYLTGSYIAGYHCFKGNKWTTHGAVMFTFSPITVPFCLAVLVVGLS